MKPLASEALKLSPRQRMGLAEVLLDSLQTDDQVDALLLSELSQRASELREGKVQGLSTEEAYGFSL